MEGKEVETRTQIYNVDLGSVIKSIKFYEDPENEDQFKVYLRIPGCKADIRKTVVLWTIGSWKPSTVVWTKIRFNLYT